MLRVIWIKLVHQLFGNGSGSILQEELGVNWD